MQSAPDIKLTRGDSRADEFSIVLLDPNTNRQFDPTKSREKKLFITTTKKRLIRYLILSIFLIVLLLISLVATSYHLLNDDTSINKDLCHTQQCIRSASNILISMDKEVDPCDDFYRFSCGNWRKEYSFKGSWTTLLSSISNRDATGYLNQQDAEDDPVAVTKARRFYRKCQDKDAMNKYGMKTFEHLLNTICLSGSSLEPSSNQTKLTETLAKVREYTGLNVLFGTNVIITNMSNIGVVKLAIDVPIDPDDLWKAFEPESESRMIDMMKNVIRQLGLSQVFLHEPYEEIKSFIHEIKEIIESDNVTTEPEIYHEMTIQELQILLDDATNSGKSKIDVKDYVDALYENTNIEMKNRSGKIIVYHEKYFELLSSFLEDKLDHEIVGYIWWVVIWNIYPQVNDDFRLSRDYFLKEKRSNDCLHITKDSMGPIAGYYLMKNLDTNRISEAKEMLKRIKTVFSKFINQLSWMDELTKNDTLDKLDFIQNIVGVSSLMKDKEKLNKFFKNVNVNGSNHLENWLEVESVKFRTLLSLIHQKESLRNFRALNYGALGSSLAHELSHGFDYTGRQIDKYGKEQNRWSEEAIDEYINKAICYIDQYDNYKKYILVNKTIDGTKTLDENLADNGGMLLAYYAYQKYKEENGIEKKLPGLEEYSSEQLFILSYAQGWCSEYNMETLKSQLDDGHAPDDARVNVVLQNLPEFSRDWNCRPGSRMNPLKKCSMWT